MNHEVLLSLLLAAVPMLCNSTIGLGTDPILDADISFAVHPSYWNDPLHPGSTEQARVGTIAQADINGYVASL
jgi:hypothetical protein